MRGTRTITDGQGRVWDCHFEGSAGRAGSEPVGTPRTPDTPTPERYERVLLHCTCGELRAAIAVPRGWEHLPEADLRRRLEDVVRLRERGPG